MVAGGAGGLPAGAGTGLAAGGRSETPVEEESLTWTTALGVTDVHERLYATDDKPQPAAAPPKPSQAPQRRTPTTAPLVD